jgi:hypothetical protein
VEAVRCARFGEPPPDDLQLYWDCKKWGTLPEGGGLLDQDAALIDRVRKLDSVYQVVKKYQTNAHDFDDREWRFIQWLIDEGLYNG